MIRFRSLRNSAHSCFRFLLILGTQTPPPFRFCRRIEKALAFCKFSGRFWSICRSLTAFESKGYVFVFCCSHTPKWSVWGRKRPLTFHRGAGVSTVNFSVFSCILFDKWEFVCEYTPRFVQFNSKRISSSFSFVSTDER